MSITPINITSESVAQTMALGKAIAEMARPGDVIALSGQLGAGKTQFVRGFAGGMGADERTVSSPTFVLMQEYDARVPVLHIDAYRLETLGELETLGWTDVLREQSVTLIEWADRVADELPMDRLDIAMAHESETERAMTLEPRGTWLDRREGLMQLNRPADVGISDLACPTCGKPACEQFMPFCSSRCKMADLNRWFDGDYRVSREVDWENDDLDALPRDDQDQDR